MAKRPWFRIAAIIKAEAWGCGFLCGTAFAVASFIGLEFFSK